jgi:hypothetical protein
MTKNGVTCRHSQPYGTKNEVPEEERKRMVEGTRDHLTRYLKEHTEDANAAEFAQVMMNLVETGVLGYDHEKDAFYQLPSQRNRRTTKRLLAELDRRDEAQRKQAELLIPKLFEHISGGSAVRIGNITIINGTVVDAETDEVDFFTLDVYEGETKVFEARTRQGMKAPMKWIIGCCSPGQWQQRVLSAGPSDVVVDRQTSIN